MIKLKDVALSVIAVVEDDVVDDNVVGSCSNCTSIFNLRFI